MVQNNRIQLLHSSFIDSPVHIKYGKGISIPRIIQNGNEIPKEHRHYTLTNDQGDKVPIKWSQDYFEPYTTLLIGKEKVRIVPKYRWYDHLLVVLPIGLLAIGGIIGVGISLLASRFNGVITVNHLHEPKKRTWMTLGVTFLSVILYLVVWGLIFKR